jgi:hypothetical protein
VARSSRSCLQLMSISSRIDQSCARQSLVHITLVWPGLAAPLTCAPAQYKLDIDNRAIQASHFNNKSTQEEQEVFLVGLSLFYMLWQLIKLTESILSSKLIKRWTMKK